MKIGLSLAACLLLAATLPAQAPPVRPRLVVLCSVDQLASWVLDDVLPHCAGDGGFRRLLDEGTRFSRCAYLHGCTETGPGHATLSTGAPARSHGIVKNQWWDPDSAVARYCVDDARVEALPDLPEGGGKGPGLLLAPTIGEGIKAHLGARARVVSVAWKDRSSILLAGPAADVAVWFHAETGRLVTSQAFGPTAPPWLAAFQERRVLDGFFGQVWERSGPASAYAGLVDDRPFEAPHGNGSLQRTLPQKLTGGLEAPGPLFYGQVYASPFGNEAVLQAALAAVQGEKLGTDDVPDLLCVGFSSTDTVGHAFGPDSVEARDGLLRLDRQLATLLQALDRQVGVGHYAFLLSADHGVGPIPEAAAQAGVPAGRGLVLTRAKGAAESALARRYGSREGKGPYVPRASEMSLFLDRTALAEAGVQGEAALREAFRIAANAAAVAPGALTAFATDELLRHGPGEDPIRRAMFFAAHPERAGDVLVVLRPFWLDGTSPASHGSPHAYDREVPLLAMGPGIAVGIDQTPVSPGLCAVLIARLLGIPKPSLAVDEVPPGVLAR